MSIGSTEIGRDERLVPRKQTAGRSQPVCAIGRSTEGEERERHHNTRPAGDNGREAKECPGPPGKQWEEAAPKWGSIRRWCAISGIGKTKSYELIARKILRAAKVDGKTLVDIEGGLDWLNNLPTVELVTGLAALEQREAARRGSEGTVGIGGAALQQHKAARRKLEAQQAEPRDLGEAAITPAGTRAPPDNGGAGPAQRRPRGRPRKVQR